ncbi:MAG: hypothetical protein HYR90_00405 [Candidatus Andersenbacteria bacterium]|nr:hypothetical protein [Candidatus Andersenbacteria bacterium]MBI3250696.1 hypothetical protein [Candidatus Andersenbacteria bacterium]
MQLRKDEHTNTRKPKNAFAILPLVVFTVISTIPHNALAFETQLATSPSQVLYAPIRLADKPTSPETRIAAVPVSHNPITVIAEVPKPKPVVVAQSAPVQRIFPTLEQPVVLEGEASYYSRAGCLGCDSMMIMANGQPLDDNALTMAIGADKKHLVGYRAKVTSLATGQSVVVKITDTGGFYQAKYGYRVADLSVATKQAIGMRGGVGQVRVEVY